MASPRKKRQKTRATRVSVMAAFCGVSDQAFRKWMDLPGFPKNEDGSVTLFDLAVWRHHYETGGEEPEEADDEGITVSHMERKRAAEASIKEIELARLREQVLDRSTVHEMLAKFASIIRGAADRIQRSNQLVAFQILEEALDAFESNLEGGVDRDGDAENEVPGGPEG